MENEKRVPLHPVAMRDLTVGIATATRGPDESVNCLRRKFYGASVIRYWIDGWSYGNKSTLPFVVIEEEADRDGDLGHYESHVENAASQLGLAVIGMDRELLSALPFPPGAIREWDSWRDGWHQFMRSWISVVGGQSAQVLMGKEK